MCVCVCVCEREGEPLITTLTIMQFACFLIYIYKWRVKSRYQKAGKERQRDTATDYNIQYYSYKTADDCNTDYNAVAEKKESKERDAATDYNTDYRRY